MRAIDYHVVKQALDGGDGFCGDTGVVKAYDGRCLMALVDALGHGQKAFEAALLARTYLLAHYTEDLTMIIKGLHAHLEGTRGVVAALCRLNLDTGGLTYAGMGNISIQVFGARPRRLVSKEGILGYIISTPGEDRETLYPGDIIVMSSDGIREHYDPVDYPGLLLGNARQIAEALMENLKKPEDDASCIVARYGI